MSRNKGIRLATLLVVLGMASFIMASPVKANGGPVSWPPSGDGPLRFDPDSGIRLVREHVNFDFGADLAHPTVDIEYVLRNTLSRHTDIQMMFITPSSSEETLQVLEGVREVYASFEADVQIDGWDSEDKKDFVEPVSGKTMTYRVHGSESHRPDVSGYSFELSFEPEETKTVTMQYTDFGGSHRVGTVNEVHTHLYYLTPAAYWNGDAMAELSIRLPARHYRVHSNIPLTRHVVTYHARLDRVPDTEWYFSFTDTTGLIFRTNNSIVHNRIIATLIFTLILMSYIQAIRYRKGRYMLYGAAASFLLLFEFVRSISGQYTADNLLKLLLSLVIAGVFGVGLIIVGCLKLAKKDKEQQTEQDRVKIGY